MTRLTEIKKRCATGDALHERYLGGPCDDDMNYLLQSLDATQAALYYAKKIIESYALDIRNSAPRVGIDLAAKGFCQGLIYQDALSTLERIERGECDPR